MRLVWLRQQSAWTRLHTWPAGAYHPNISDTLVSAMQVLAQHSDDLHADIAMFAKQLQQLFPAYETTCEASRSSAVTS